MPKVPVSVLNITWPGKDLRLKTWKVQARLTKIGKQLGAQEEG